VRRRLLRLVLLGLGGWLAVQAIRLLRGDAVPVLSGTPTGPPPDEAPGPAPVVVGEDDAAPWIDGAAGPSADHPVKAKLRSGIYHLPGMLNYERCTPDRWYRDAEAAEADGLRPAKR
jgi:hypothetical protein